MLPTSFVFFFLFPVLTPRTRRVLSEFPPITAETGTNGQELDRREEETRPCKGKAVVREGSKDRDDEKDVGVAVNLG